jgi:hypothetical protein
MTTSNEILSQRREDLASNASSLSKEKFLSIRALSYCLGFVGSSIEQLSPSSHPLDLTQVLETHSQHLPPDWIAIRSQNLIVEDFEQYDLMNGHVFATRMMNYMRSQLFIALMMELEDYLNQLIVLILSAYPGKLNGEHFKIEEVLKESNALDLMDDKIEKKLMKKQYGRARQFFNFVIEVLEIDATINNLLDERNIDDEKARKLEHEKLAIEQFYPAYLEMKARRNIGIHNGWRRNQRYEEDIASGIEIEPSIDDGKVFLGVDKTYFERASTIAIELIAKCNILCQLKFNDAH